MIEINNLTTLPIKEEFLKEVAEKVLKGEGMIEVSQQRNNGLSIALLGSGRTRQINKKYRKKNRVTDVLTFPETKKGPIQKTKSLGEIVICPREVKKNSKRFGTPFEKELSRVLIHGILHLLGYDHEENFQKAKEMEKKQNYYLRLINKS
ncbi:MAG: rRNA maturation RNase YbeY [Candidatus Nealsonbacteria bacterium CG03_land_8_20_14_0_80_36_12]|uniref:Endoribonuclease YbeY n=1 Tax=Candidatus Nealsonbacteria bacterium CG03_land_8_20_14_0_80_36_12 TaxID=1974701 RepID=A0A2M7BYX8_9BACT|nr:MAG: rRNA maturation RNase YbeY [Candidatus Nealsonbacteria bacterium CG03_land_8_20_14_0_80_36_12]